MPYCIRPFQKTDFETLWRIDQICFDPQLAYSQVELAVYMRRRGAFTLVAEGSEVVAGASGTAAGRTLGFIVAEANRGKGHIITIDVIPEERRSGLGSALLAAAEEQMQQAGATTVDLETPVNNMAAICFYKRKGFFIEKTVRGYYSNQLDAFVMGKDLVAVLKSG